MLVIKSISDFHFWYHSLTQRFKCERLEQRLNLSALNLKLTLKTTLEIKVHPIFPGNKFSRTT